MKISLLTATYGRVDVLRRCVESGIKNAGIDDFEWLIWDNSSKDGTADYLKTISDKRIKVTRHNKNIGLNAYKKLAEMAKGEYFVTVDEDVVWFSDFWLKKLLTAYWDAPFPWRVWGWLGCDTIKDDKTNGALWPEWVLKSRIVDSGAHKFIIDRKIPQTCAMTHREIYRMVGGFSSDKKQFFKMDTMYGRSLDKFRFPQAICLDIQIYHACGPYFYQDYPNLWKEKHGETLKHAAEIYFKQDPSLLAYKKQWNLR